MKKGKDLKILIKENIHVEKPSPNFTSNLMKEIHKLETTKEEALFLLIKKYSIEEPSEAFTSQIMQKINKNSELKVYQPVISKKAWYFIYSALSLIIFFAMFYAEEKPSTVVLLIDNFTKTVSKLFTFRIPALLLSPVFATSIFALSSFLLLDWFAKTKKSKANN